MSIRYTGKNVCELGRYCCICWNITLHNASKTIIYCCGQFKHEGAVSKLYSSLQLLPGNMGDRVKFFFCFYFTNPYSFPKSNFLISHQSAAAAAAINTNITLQPSHPNIFILVTSISQYLWQKNNSCIKASRNVLLFLLCPS